MLAGSEDWDCCPRDLEYFRELGLLAPECPVRMANPIYAEAIPRRLALVLESTMAGSVDPAWYVKADGGLDLAKLLSDFQIYFWEKADSWVEQFGHAEAGSQLVLHAYLQLVVNNRGRVEREYAAGRGRTDLLIEWHQSEGQAPMHSRKYVIECKIHTGKVGLEHLIRDGRKQVAAYMDRSGAESGHLVIFDLRPDKSREERVFRNDPKPGGRPLTVWGI